MTTPAERLHQAFHGFGTCDAIVIDVVSSLPNSSLLAAAKEYEVQYNTPIRDEIRSDTSGPFQEALLWLFTPREEREAQALQRALEKIGSGEPVIIEIASTRTAEEMLRIKAAYRFLFQASLEEDLTSRLLAAEFRRIIVELFEGFRSESIASSRDAVWRDARDMINAVEGRAKDSKEKVWTDVLTTRSHLHILAVGDIYQQETQKSLVQTIHAGMMGDSGKILAALASPADFIAGQIHQCLKSSDHIGLLRLFCDTPPYVLRSAKIAYRKRYQLGVVEQLFEIPESIGALLRRLACGFMVNTLRLKQALEENDEPTVVSIITAVPSKHELYNLAEGFFADFGLSLEALVKKLSPEPIKSFLATLFVRESLARRIRRLLSGGGPKDEVILDIVAVPVMERQQLPFLYRTEFERDIIADVKDEFQGEVEDILIKLLQGAAVVQEPLPTEEVEKWAGYLSYSSEHRSSQLIELVTNFSSVQISQITEHLRTVHQLDIEKIVSQECSGDLETTIMAACVPTRCIARQLYRYLKDLGGSEDLFMSIIGSRSKDELAELDTEFQLMYGEALGPLFDSVFIGTLRTAVQAYLAAV
eukprot:TRINITY_DN2481_c0_g1_i1.p1 TRINITY_DN2481_c0_g1~~TRINITY_DN2481_c0_g1_i1.p1  ORF type:complete len:597 (+),score=97.81 TRINITY_DN2481_c0_g1_i1:25-1791(+)